MQDSRIITVFAAAIGMLPPDENWQRSESAVNKALQLDDSRAETYNALSGVQFYYHRDWNAAERSFRRGLELNDASAEVHRHYAKCLVLFGRNDEALAHMKRALELEPLSVSYSVDAARIFFWLGQYPQAVEQINNTLDLSQNSLVAHDLLGDVYEKMGNERAAIDEWSKVFSLTRREDFAAKLKNTYEHSGLAFRAASSR
jgi:tetratricopeptide (TPR) repeat protein